MFLWNKSEFDSRVRKSFNPPRNHLSEQYWEQTEGGIWRLEGVFERLIVEEDVGVLEFFVETILYLLHTANDTIQVTVSSCSMDQWMSKYMIPNASRPNRTKVAFAFRSWGVVLFDFT